MIIFFVTTAHTHTLQKVITDAAGIDVRMFTRTIPCGTIIFSDLDRLPTETLRTAAMLFRKLRDAGLTVLNDPARVLSRSGLLRRLFQAGVNSFNAYHAEYGEQPQRWPVFLRTEGDHNNPFAELYDDEAALERGVAKIVESGIPISRLLIVEFAGEPVKPGLYRKLSTFRVGRNSFGHTCVHNPHWIAKDGVRGIAGDELYDDELRIVRDNPYGPALEKAFDIAGIDYGRADFSIVKGRVEVYEINSNPKIGWDGNHPSAARRESLETFKRNYFNALAAINTT